MQASLITPLQTVHWQPFQRRNIQLLIKREDLVDSACSGNKFYKLHYHLEAAIARNARYLLSFGGAYSNHLHALAAAGKRHGLKTIGVVRGERPRVLSPTLRDAQGWGMELHFIDRGTYRQKESEAVLSQLRQTFADFYCIPEGGGSHLGARGCQAIARGIIQQSPVPVDLICVACGTGATLAGIASALVDTPTTRALGFSVLKGAGDMSERIKQLLTELGAGQASWQLDSEFHCGGYARFPEYLQQFMTEFESSTGILLDPVYTAKMLWGLTQKAQRGELPPGSCVVAVHTGGLQGRRGFDLSYTENKVLPETRSSEYR